MSRSKITLISLALIVLAVSSFNSVFAQALQDMSCTSCITISDAKNLGLHKNLQLPIILWAENFDYTYDHNSIITINGHSKLNNPETPITITVTNPIGNIVTVQQIMVAPNSDFNVKFNPGGPLWAKDGMYIIKAQGGAGAFTIFKTNVELTGGVPTGVECAINELNADNYCIPYSITGATVSSSSLNTKNKSIVMVLSDSDEGAITIKPSTDIIKGISLVLVDGQEWDDVTISGNDVTIMFPAGTEEIEVIGTFVVPEFGSFAVLILIVAIITGVVFSRKRLMFPNKISTLSN
ncbi:MAG: PEFG-CTERM sorting domain-containing protein [Nitrosopumilaceae archaeon]